MHKTLLNAKVNFVFYFLTIVANFIARKIFLDYLGDEFVGLTGTLLNVLGYLNLAELGVSSAIAFNLYKPIKDNDRGKISEIISLLGYYYRNIGMTVGIIGVVVSIFLYPSFMHSSFREFGVIYFAFYTFLISALLGYFMNYRQILLVADQRNYIVSSLYQSSNIIKAIVQIVIAIYYHNFYAWIAIELVFSVAYSLVLNRKISRVYPWLQTRIREGKAISKKFPNIFKSTKQVFIHRIKDFLLTQSDLLFVSIFVSIKMSAVFGNYALIITKTTQLFNTLLDSVLASVGNLVAENDRQRMIKVFWELMAIRYFLAGFISVMIFWLIDPFISLFFGEQYLLGPVVVWLLLINLFIVISRGTVDNYNFAFGHFGDVWAAWTEMALNVGCTVVAGYFWGIPGILFGKTFSYIPIVVFWKPYYLFRDGFHESYALYWRGTVKYLICFAVCAAVSYALIGFVSINPYSSYIDLVIFGVIGAVIFGFIYLMSIMVLCPGGKSLINRLKNLRRKIG